MLSKNGGKEEEDSVTVVGCAGVSALAIDAVGGCAAAAGSVVSALAIDAVGGCAGA